MTMMNALFGLLYDGNMLRDIKEGPAQHVLRRTVIQAWLGIPKTSSPKPGYSARASDVNSKRYLQNRRGGGGDQQLESNNLSVHKAICLADCSATGVQQKTIHTWFVDQNCCGLSVPCLCMNCEGWHAPFLEMHDQIRCLHQIIVSDLCLDVSY